MTIGNITVGDKTGEQVQFLPFDTFSGGPAVSLIGEVDINDPGRKVRQEVSFVVELIPQNGGGYFVNVPALPSGSTQGRTLPEAVSNVRDNLEGLLEDVVKGELCYEKTPEFLGLPQNRVTVRVPHP